MSTDLRSGVVFDHYRLQEKLGEGGMGVVWLAEDTRLGRKVALKFLSPEATQDEARRQRFTHEARAAAALSHPGIATVFELGDADGQPYIVFEYVPGYTLRTLVRPGGLAQEEVLAVAHDIAEALLAAHDAAMIHRDLKPENVMRMPAGRCKILDFGLARMSPTATGDSEGTRSLLTSPGMVIGTAAYMAPEQLEGKEVDFRSDLFAFGILLYELATGVHPFRAGSGAATIAAIMSGEAMPLTQRNPQHSGELERIVRKCMRKRREERYQSTLDLTVDLRNLIRDCGDFSPRSDAPSVITPPSKNESAVRRSLLRRIAAGQLAFALLLAAPVGAGNVPWETLLQGFGDALTWTQLSLILYALALWVAGFALLTNALLLVREGLPAVQTFRRWFAAYLGADLLGIGGWIWLVQQGHIPGVVGVGLTVILLCLPFAQLRMAREALDETGGVAPGRVLPGFAEIQLRRRAVAWWWLHHLASMLFTTPLVVLLSWEARSSMATGVRDPVFLVNALALGLHWSARFALVSQGLGNPANLAAEARRMRRAILWTGWPVIFGLLLSAYFSAGTNVVQAAVLAALAMGGVACLLFLDPAVARAAFPDSTMRP